MKEITRKRKDGLAVKVKVFENLDECIASAGGGNAEKGSAKLVEFLTMYALQKDVFPEAFDDLLAAIETEAGFERKHTVTTLKNDDGTTKDVKKYVAPHETEGDYVKDFRRHASEHGVHGIGLHPDVSGAAVVAWLQSVLSRKVYELDLSRAGKERKVKIDEVFLKGARGGIVDKTGEERERWIAKWKANFEKLGVAYDDFETEDVQANVNALGMALYKYTLAKSASQFA